MADSQSKEVYFLKQVKNQTYNKDFAVSMVQMQNTITSLSKYLIVMQQGIDDANRDLVEQIQDFIDDIIVILGGGGDTGFDFGDLKYVFQAIGTFFGFNTWSGGTAWTPLQMIQNMFENFMKPFAWFGTAINNLFDQAIDFILGLLSWIPGVGTVREKFAGALNNTTSTANNAQTTVVSVTQQVNYVQQVIAIQSGMGVWETGPDRTGTPSFPYGLLNLHTHTMDQHRHKNGSTNGVPNYVDYTTSTVAAMKVPTVNATASYAPISNVIFKSAAERKIITFLAYKTGTVSTFYLDVYRFNQDGSTELVYSSPNIAGDLTTNLGWIQHFMSSPILTDIGDSYEVQFSMTGSGSVSLAGVNMPNPVVIPGIRPYTIGAGRNASGTRAPATISTATRDSMGTGPAAFVSFGIDVGQSTIPRFFYDDFNRDDSALGNLWTRFGSIKLASNKLVHANDFGSNLRSALRYNQQLLTDKVSTEFDLEVAGYPSGGGICCNSDLTDGAWCVADASKIYISTGPYNGQTTRASLDIPSGYSANGRYKFTYDPADNTFRVYKDGGSSSILDWPDSSNIVAHGSGRRWVGPQVSSNGLGGTSKIDQWIAQDV